jgi:hypothetical protein
MQKTKRNPQDATLRNIRAVKKRILQLETRVDTIENAVKTLARRLTKGGPA